MIKSLKFKIFKKNHNYDITETLSIDEGIKRIEDISKIKKISKRKLFLKSHLIENHTKCVCCGLEGVKICNGYNKNDKSYHLDLYSENDVMLTIDHVNPVSISKDDTYENTQLLCNVCNAVKGYDMRNYELHKALIDNYETVKYTNEFVIINNFEQIEASLYDTLTDYITEAKLKNNQYLYVKLF
jgi:hypothetical protein